MGQIFSSNMKDTLLAENISAGKTIVMEPDTGEYLGTMFFVEFTPHVHEGEEAKEPTIVTLALDKALDVLDRLTQVLLAELDPLRSKALAQWLVITAAGYVELQELEDLEKEGEGGVSP